MFGMKRMMMLGLFVLLSGQGWGQVAGQKIIEGFDSPESIASDGKYVYVSNMGKVLNATAKDADGYISRLSLSGEVLDKQFLPEKGMLHSPKGIVVVGRMLYVADVDRLLGFDLRTRLQVLEIDFSGEKTLFLNDVAVKNDRTLFVSATDIGKIYQVTLSPGKPYFKALSVKGEIKGPNGLAYQPATRDLFVVGFGKENQPNGQVGVIHLRKEAFYEVFSETAGLLDGAVLLRHSKLLFSDWIAFEKKGEIKMLDLKTKEVKTLEVGGPVSGPADFYYNPISRKLWIPEIMGGKIRIVELKR